MNEESEMEILKSFNLILKSGRKKYKTIIFCTMQYNSNKQLSSEFNREATDRNIRSIRKSKDDLNIHEKHFGFGRIQ